eukprot:GABW01000486.1.p1 GENE.GABW01000486.1~~GABW01000486.1.p1  ORF type:complete len:50 (+),score=1.85 GABW01000486.1:46-195(+)
MHLHALQIILKYNELFVCVLTDNTLCLRIKHHHISITTRCNQALLWDIL